MYQREPIPDVGLTDLRKRERDGKAEAEFENRFDLVMGSGVFLLVSRQHEALLRRNSLDKGNGNLEDADCISRDAHWQTESMERTKIVSPSKGFRNCGDSLLNAPEDFVS